MTSHKLSWSKELTSVSLSLAASTTTAASSAIPPVTPVVATIVVSHPG
jgi:hypothetical protein